MTKYFIIASMLFSLALANGPRNWKKWHKKKHRAVKKHKIHKVVHRANNITLKYGYHWCFTPWKNLYSMHNHKDLIVIRDSGKEYKNPNEIFEQIEHLGSLRERDLLTEKEFEKAKKDLLKRI